MGDSNDAFMRNRDAAVQARTKAQNRATVLQLKLIGQSHPTGLTTNLLKLFEPRPPLEYKPPPEKRKCPPYTGMAQFVSNFAEPGEPEYAPPVQEAETRAEKRARIHRLCLEKGALQAAEELQKYDPHNDPNVTGDPYKTLFVARLNYETTEHRIKREFEVYGPIKRVRLITDKETNKPRGYAFIEYLHTRDMKNAYKQADGRKLDNRRVIVDVERGRTVPNWRPRRLGGGLGSTRVGGEEVNQKYSGREPQQITSGSTAHQEEPRAREDRQYADRDREKSRERGRDHEWEKSRDRDPREDRHHRDRDKNRDRDRERERGRDRDRARDKERDRDHDQDRVRGRDRDRDRPHRRERDYDYQREHRGRSIREKNDEYDGGDHVEPVSDHALDHDYYNHDAAHGQRQGFSYGHDRPRHYEQPEKSYEHELNEPELYDRHMDHEDTDYHERIEREISRDASEQEHRHSKRSRSHGYDDE